jgi:hypothetical protein
MKKFSKITNQTVGEQKSLEKKITEVDIMRAKIYNLMENYLRVQMYGPVDKYQRAGLVKVAGKELFLEALLSMLEEYSTTKNIKLLESMKSETSDWKLLDDKIENLNLQLETIKEGKLIPHKEKIKSIITKSKDKKVIFEQIDNSISKISNPQTALLRAQAATYLISEGVFEKELLTQIAKKYLDKSKELSISE